MKQSVLLDHVCKEEEVELGGERDLWVLYFTELAIEVWVRKGQRLQDCCPRVAGKSRGAARHSRARMLNTLLQPDNTGSTSHRQEQAKKVTWRSARPFRYIWILLHPNVTAGTEALLWLKPETETQGWITYPTDNSAVSGLRCLFAFLSSISLSCLQKEPKNTHTRNRCIHWHGGCTHKFY